MPEDRMPVAFCFERNFETKLPSKSEAEGHTAETESGPWFHLGTVSSIFQTETIVSLMVVANKCRFKMNAKEIIICSDSKPEIKALVSPVTNSKLVEKCKDYLNQIDMRNPIAVHSVVEGNERADEPESLCAKTLNEWIKIKHAERWQKYEAMHFLSEPVKKWSSKLLRMNRNPIRRVVGATSGHCGMNKHLRGHSQSMHAHKR